MFPLATAANAILLRNLFLLLLIPLVLVFTFFQGKDSGRTEVQAKWDAETVVRLEAEKLAMLTRKRDNEKLKTQHEMLLEQTKENYEELLSKRIPPKLTGLRLPKGSCPSSDSPRVPSPTRDTSLPTSPPSSGRLPDKVEQDLRELAKDAQSCTIQLTQLQKLIINNQKLNKNRKES